MPFLFHFLYFLFSKLLNIFDRVRFLHFDIKNVIFILLILGYLNGLVLVKG